MDRLREFLVGFTILSGGFAILERCWPAIRRTGPWRTDLKTDLAWWVFTPFVSKAVVDFTIGILFFFLYRIAVGPPTEGAVRLWILQRDTWVTALPIGVQVALVLVIGELLGYWSHRMFHSRRWWPYHAVHHSPEHLDWLAAVRVHPVNEIINRVIQVFPLFLMGFNLMILAAYTPFLTIYALLLHANVPWDFGPFRRVIASPAFHRWHHTSQAEGLDKNFAGLFPCIDALFGTLYLPVGVQPTRFGDAAKKVPRGFWGQLGYPFKATSAR